MVLIGGELTQADFPMISQGNRIYAQTKSSPIAACLTVAMAQEIAARLNEGEVGRVALTA